MPAFRFGVFSVVVLLSWSAMLVGRLGAQPRVQKMAVQVPTIAEVRGPGAVQLDPGEQRRVVVQVAANFAWQLQVSTNNGFVKLRTSSVVLGSRGGFRTPGNTVTVELECDPRATGPQLAVVALALDRRSSRARE